MTELNLDLFLFYFLSKVSAQFLYHHLNLFLNCLSMKVCRSLKHSFVLCFSHCQFFSSFFKFQHVITMFELNSPQLSTERTFLIFCFKGIKRCSDQEESKPFSSKRTMVGAAIELIKYKYFGANSSGLGFCWLWLAVSLGI